jgi:hypothetical protein
MEPYVRALWYTMRKRKSPTGSQRIQKIPRSPLVEGCRGLAEDAAALPHSAQKCVPFPQLIPGNRNRAFGLDRHQIDLLSIKAGPDLA